MTSTDHSHILNELAFGLLKESDQGKEVCISPLGILGNLNILIHSTSSEKVIAQIDKLLHLNETEKKKKQDEKVKIICDLINHVTNGDKEFVEFKQENGIYVSSGVALENLDSLKHTKICKDDAGVKVLNEEIEKLSGHRLKSFLNPQNKPKSGVTLFSYIHIKASFCNIFRPDSTEIGEFHVSASKTIKIPMLKSGGMLMYNEDKEIGARIMYHSFLGCNFSVLVVVPIKKFGLAEMEKKLTAEKYSHLTGNMRSVLGSLAIPKLALNNVTDVSASLKKTGVTDIFDGSVAHLASSTSVIVKCR